MAESAAEGRPEESAVSPLNGEEQGEPQEEKRAGSDPGAAESASGIRPVSDPDTEEGASAITAESPAEGSDPAPVRTALEVELEQLSQRMKRIEELIEKRLAYDAGKENLIRCLGEELQNYRDDWLKRQKRPVLFDLVVLYDSLERIMENLERREGLSPLQLREMLVVLQDELLEVMARQDLYPFDEHLPYLDRRRHRTVALEPTDQPEENNAVAKIIRTGFTWGEQVFRPEDVVIKKYQAEGSEGGNQ